MMSITNPPAQLQDYNRESDWITVNKVNYLTLPRSGLLAPCLLRVSPDYV